MADADRFAVTDTLAPRVERNWILLFYLNLYRFVLATVLLLSNLLDPRWRPFGQFQPEAFLLATTVLISLSVVSMAAVRRRWPSFDTQIDLQVVADILLMSVMLATSGGERSGLGLLMMVSLVSSALVSHGRTVMFYAALATMSVLIVQTLIIWHDNGGSTDMGQAGLLGMAFFVMAGVAYVLAERNRRSEALAATRAADLQNMAQINQLVIDDMQDGVIVLDGEGGIRQVNRQAHKLLGEHEANRALAQRIPLLAHYLEQWRENHNQEFPVIALGERNEQYQPRFIPVTNRRVMGAVLLLKDMSRIHEEAQQIKLAALGRLTANIAHEIRNPLAAISHASELMSELVCPGQERLLEIVLHNTERINHLIQDVMALNRRDRMQVQSIELATFLAEFIDEFVRVQHLAESCIQWRCPNTVRLCFDREHLRQVFTNLSLNAVRHSQQRAGSVQIHVESLRGVTTIHFFDDGPGVTPDHLLRLFEPFFTTESAGTGLGLYISRELCQANGASLDYVAGASGGHFRIMSQEEICQDKQ